MAGNISPIKNEAWKIEPGQRQTGTAFVPAPASGGGNTLLYSSIKPYDGIDASWVTTGPALYSSVPVSLALAVSDHNFGLDDLNGDEGVTFEMTPPGMLQFFVQVRVAYEDGNPATDQLLRLFLYDGANTNFYQATSTLTWSTGEGQASCFIAVPVLTEWETDANPASTKNILAGFSVESTRVPEPLRMRGSAASLIWMPFA